MNEFERILGTLVFYFLKSLKESLRFLVFYFSKSLKESLSPWCLIFFKNLKESVDLRCFVFEGNLEILRVLFLEKFKTILGPNSVLKRI